jgi:hypothetical protein
MQLCYSILMLSGGPGILLAEPTTRIVGYLISFTIGGQSNNKSNAAARFLHLDKTAISILTT